MLPDLPDKSPACKKCWIGRATRRRRPAGLREICGSHPMSWCGRTGRRRTRIPALRSDLHDGLAETERFADLLTDDVGEQLAKVPAVGRQNKVVCRFAPVELKALHTRRN